MIKPISAMFYCYVWLNSDTALTTINYPSYTIANQPTVNNIITNETMYDINGMLESIFIKEE